MTGRFDPDDLAATDAYKVGFALGRVRHLQDLPGMPPGALELLGDLEARLLYGWPTDE